MLGPVVHRVENGNPLGARVPDVLLFVYVEKMEKLAIKIKRN